MPEITLIFDNDGTVRWRPSGNASSGGGRMKYNWIEGPACPQHGSWKVVPGGWSEKKQKNYEAFYVCSNDDCPNRPGKTWSDKHPAAGAEVYEDDAPWPDDPLA